MLKLLFHIVVVILDYLKIIWKLIKNYFENFLIIFEKFLKIIKKLLKNYKKIIKKL